MTQDEIDHYRDWYASEQAGIKYFEKQGEEYPGHLSVNISGLLLDEVDKLRGIIIGLLDGLDANDDAERCGLSQSQWDKRIKEARDAIGEH